jgi:hypothetical protein
LWAGAALSHDDNELNLAKVCVLSCVIWRFRHRKVETYVPVDQDTTHVKTKSGPSTPPVLKRIAKFVTNEQLVYVVREVLSGREDLVEQIKMLEFLASDREKFNELVDKCITAHQTGECRCSSIWHLELSSS